MIKPINATIISNIRLLIGSALVVMDVIMLEFYQKKDTIRVD